MKQKTVFFVLLLGIFSFIPASYVSGATYIAEPVLISQPAYFGNSFYMYRPSDTPAGSLLQVNPYGNVAFQNPQNLQQQQQQFYSSAPQRVVPPQSTHVSVPQISLQGPSWLVDRNFMMVSAWKGLVDRMGILYKPKLPLAWKGEAPQAIFVWTGKSWWQMHCKNGETPQETLQRNMFALAKLSKEHQASWSPEDAGFLANQAALWGYYWMGYVLPESR
jgi:hypothetical protein